MNETIVKKFLLIVRFNDEQPAKIRATQSGPLFAAVLQRHCGKETQLAFTSRDASTFGYIIKTTTPIRVIHRALFGEEHAGSGTAALLNGDNLLALELGPEFDGRGFSRAWTWLQHH